MNFFVSHLADLRTNMLTNWNIISVTIWFALIKGHTLRISLIMHLEK